jgi:DNA-binding transcriptional regulator YhcF (GntR family)
MGRMFETIDSRSPTPLYDQIAARVKIAVASGDLRPGAALPSVRQLAAKLRVNPATVVQAYRTLETEGFVEMRQGAGTYVKEVTNDKRAKEQAEQATRLVRAMLAEAASLGIPAETLARAVERALGVKAA